MVARPPVRVRIEPMSLDDLDAIQRIEALSFSVPWPEQAYRSEIQTNRLASYLVAKVEGKVIAYGGIWLMVDEAHVTTVAVDPGWRRQKIGARLLLALLDVALARGAHEATLEVRLSNLPARRMYEAFGFRPVGLRPRYYSDNDEDALIMTTDPLDTPGMRSRLDDLRTRIDAAPTPSGRRPDVPGHNDRGEPTMEPHG